jgi:hypothetical protein
MAGSGTIRRRQELELAYSPAIPSRLLLELKESSPQSVSVEISAFFIGDGRHKTRPNPRWVARHCELTTRS